MQPFKPMTIATTETSHTNRIVEEIASGCIHRLLEQSAAVMKAQHRLGHEHNPLGPKHKHRMNATQVEGTETMLQSNAAEQSCRAKLQSKQHDAHKTESTMKKNKLAQ